MMCGERLWSATTKNCFEDKVSFGTTPFGD